MSKHLPYKIPFRLWYRPYREQNKSPIVGYAATTKLAKFSNNRERTENYLCFTHAPDDYYGIELIDYIHKREIWFYLKDQLEKLEEESRQFGDRITDGEIRLCKKLMKKYKVEGSQ